MIMPLRLRFFKVLASETISKTCSHHRPLQLLPSTVSNLISKQSYHISAELWHSFEGYEKSSSSRSSKDLVDANSKQVLRKLKFAKSVEDVLSTVSCHLSVMSDSHRTYALEAIWKKHQNKQTSMSRNEIIKSPGFKNLCDSSLSHLRSEDLSVQITWLKYLTCLKVSSKTPIMQELLNLIRKQVNDLSLRDIIVVDSLISPKGGTLSPQVETLKSALPPVFNAKLEEQIDRTDIKLLHECLIYVSKEEVSSSYFNFIVSLLSAYDEHIPVNIAHSIIRSLGSRPVYDDSYAPLLLQVMDLVAKSVERFCPHELSTTLFLVLEKAIRHEAFQHVIFVERCIKRILTASQNWRVLLALSNYVRRARFSSPELANALCDKILLSPEEFGDVGFGPSIDLIKNLARYSNSKPKNWDRLEPIVLKSLRKHMNHKTLPWSTICLSLVTLDSWPRDILNRTLAEDYLEHIFKERIPLCKRFPYSIMAANHQAIHLLCPGDFSWSIPPRWWKNLTSILLSYYKSDWGSTSPLLPALAKGLGGTEYLYSNVVTQHLHFIDHLIVMRKGGYPVAAHSINCEENELIQLEDIPVPSGSLFVGVVVIKPSTCSINEQVLLGRRALQLRTLEAMGIAAVPILLSKWEKLLEREKIPYIMREIHNKTKDHKAMARF